MLDKIRLSLPVGFPSREAARDSVRLSLDPAVQGALELETSARDGDTEEAHLSWISEEQMHESTLAEVTEFGHR